MGKASIKVAGLALPILIGCAALSSKVATTKARTITTGDIDISGSTLIAVVQTVALAALILVAAYWTIWHRKKYHNKTTSASSAVPRLRN